MIKEKSLELFTAVPKVHNCAQAVICGAGREDLKDAMAVCGGGKAPDGICGALHAALLLAPAAENEEIKRKFAAQAGDITCRQIKAASYPCVKCVELAADLLENL